MSESGREMTLAEWVGRLPKAHLAHREHDELVAEVERLRSDLAWMTGMIRNGGYVISPCVECGRPVVCLPDGMGGMCVECCGNEAAEASREASKPAPPYGFDEMSATRDGVTVIDPDAALWYIASDGKVYCHHPWSQLDIPTMYSTKAAAEAAKTEKGEV